jgi:hypothetical protein
MKKLLSLIIALVSVFSTYAQTPTEYFSVGKSIKYCGTKFEFAWSAHPTEIYYVQEYLPKGESFEHYNQMFSVCVLFYDRTPLEAVQAKIEELEQRKKTDPVTNYTVTEKDGEYILEFIVSDSNNGELNTVEVDVHHYKRMTVDGKTASVLCFYSSRAYGDDIMPFIQSIPQKRQAWYSGLSKLNIKPTFLNKQ